MKRSKLKRAVERELARIQLEGAAPIGARSRPRRRPQPIEQPRIIEPKKRDAKQAEPPRKITGSVVVHRIERRRGRGGCHEK